MNYRYYSNLDKIIMRSRRRRMARRYLEMAKELGKYLLVCLVFYGGFYFVWSMLCYVFPDW